MRIVDGHNNLVTRQIVSNKLLAYLNQQINLAELVDWVDMLNDILAYLAAADTTQFPLTWDVCADFLNQLGVKVQVIATQSLE